MRLLIPAVLAATTLLSAATRPDGLYAEIRTTRGLIVAKLDMDLVPMTVANFVGLSEGTIANTALDLGRPFFDGTVIHRVEAGHVIQTGVPKGGRTQGPGYQFPNEVHAKLSHNHIGSLNMANGGPNTNASQWCIMLGDRSYLDGDFSVFGDTVEGLDVLMKIEKNDVVESIKIVRVGAKANAFHPTTESFQAMVIAAQRRAMDQMDRKRAAEIEWIAKNYPKTEGGADGLLTEQLAAGTAGASAGPLQVRYHGTEVRYVGDVIAHEGGPINPLPFGSNEKGVPVFTESPATFAYSPGVTKINPGLDRVLAKMQPGERRIVVVPAALAYGKGGTYPPEIPGKKRFVVSPFALLVYDVEVMR